MLNSAHPFEGLMTSSDVSLAERTCTPSMKGMTLSPAPVTPWVDIS
jgi:hypothetical protein